MRIAITPEGFDEVRRKLAALPAGCQADVYGLGFIHAARRAAKRASSTAPRGAAVPLTSKGKPRRRLADSIRAIRVDWHWGGEKVRKSAAIVLAEQPHAHLVERGTVRMAPRPFLEPAIAGQGTLTDFRVGSARAFGRLVKRLEKGKLTARERRAFRV